VILPTWDDLTPEQRDFALNSGVLTRKQLETLRMTATMSQRQIATALGVSRGAVQDRHRLAVERLFKEMAA
jgi:DNA-directed RNA polymerase specialized sigma24 family protein